MDGTKSWYTSKTLWGSIIAGVSMLLQVFHIGGISEGDQATLVTMITQAAGGVGVLLTIWGRIAANKTIGSS